MLKRVLQFLSYVLTALLACVLTLFLMSGRTLPTDGKLGQLNQLIDQYYIEQVDQKALQDGAAEGMVAALGDRWSYYIPADEYASYLEQMENAYVGIGVTILQRQDGAGLDILEVTAGGPAEDVGILAGDILIAVGGIPLADMDITNVRDMVRGEEGTSVTLTVLRSGEQLEFSVVRRKFQTPVATSQMLPGNIGLITIENFDARCAQETLAAIEELMKQGAEKLIFDVRNNPGGYKSELTQVLDHLLPEGEIFHGEYYDGTVEKDTSDSNCLNIPMAVLVNRDSYSAAEFFAAALSEYDKAVIVGEATSGKGYFQSVFQLSDGSAVGLSIGKYYTPSGVSLEGVGIVPDVVVEVDEETFAKIYYGTVEPMDDPQIQAAVAKLSEQ